MLASLAANYLTKEKRKKSPKKKEKRKPFNRAAAAKKPKGNGINSKTIITSLKAFPLAAVYAVVFWFFYRKGCAAALTLLYFLFF